MSNEPIDWTARDRHADELARQAHESAIAPLPKWVDDNEDWKRWV